MLDKASLKLGLDHAVLRNKEGNNNGPVQQFSKKEIKDLLRKGAHAAIMDENDEGNRFCQEDIDQILQRRATIITITRILPWRQRSPLWSRMARRVDWTLRRDRKRGRVGRGLWCMGHVCVCRKRCGCDMCGSAQGPEWVCPLGPLWTGAPPSGSAGEERDDPLRGRRCLAGARK
nr:uncharacterized protein LOC117461330 isoform X1 [Pseudochaenichthys georgianus]